MKQKTQFQIWWINYILAPFSWSRWTDIATFSYGSTACLLQGKCNSRTNAKRFKITTLKQRFAINDVQHMEMKRLIECGLIDEQLKYNS